MLRTNMVLLFFIVFCALGVVTSQHKARKLYSQLQKEEQQTKRLNVEWGQLQLEQSTWAMHSRIEHEAVKALGMQVPGTNRTQVILPRGEVVARPQVTDTP